MTERWRRRLVWLAAYIVALQTIFAGLAPISATAFALDPASSICHSGAPSDDGNSPAQPSSQTHQCDHCVLCNAVAAADSPSASIGAVPPIAAAALPAPVSTAANARIGASPQFARGPPSAA